MSLLFVAACETREVVELRAMLAEREKELSRMRPFADELNIARRDREATLAKLPKPGARATASKEAPSAAKLLEALRALPEVEAYAVGRFEVTADGASKATLEPIRLPEPAAVQPAQRPPRQPGKPLPEPSLLSGSEGRKLRAQIARADAEIAALRGVIAELDKLSLEFLQLRSKLLALEGYSWGRLRAEPGLLDKLFGEPRPLLASGRLEAVPGGFRVTGKLSAGVGLDELRAVVPSGHRVGKLVDEQGTVTLEAAR